MVHDINAIFDHGVFRPLEPIVLADGTRVHLRVEEQNSAADKQTAPTRILSPRLVDPEQIAEFRMEVREAPDAGV
jgi:predicted DNA-binding antitoxin AbrB/MazE fold protein